MASDGRVVIDVILDDGQVAKGVANVDRSLGGLGGTAQKSALSIGKIATALGLVYLAKKGIDLVRDSLSGAISRFDTLNQFPRVMQMIGFDAEQSEAAIQKLSDGVQGLPTKLEDVASTAQNIAVMTGDLDGAVDTTLALNNAFLASGASTADAERGLQQYVQMLSKGEVDLQSWRTLQETMGVALNQLAEDFGYTGDAAQMDLYDALKSGEVTFDEFNAKLIEASERQGGFADMAIEGSKGIATSWGNIKQAVVVGVTGILQEIDKLLGGTGDIEDGFEGIVGVLETVKEAVYSVFGWITGQIPIVADKIKNIYEAFKPWIPMLQGIITVVTAFVAGFATVSSIIGIINRVRNAFMLLNAVLMANPVGLVVGAIAALIAILVIAYQKSETFREVVNTAFEAVKEVVTSVISVVTDFIMEMWGFLVNWWEENNESIMETANRVWTAIQAAIEVVMDFIVPYLQTMWENVKTNIEIVWEFIKMYIENALTLITGIIETVMHIINGNWSEAWETIKATFITMWNNMREAGANITNKIKEIIKRNFELVKNHIMEKLAAAKNALVARFQEMLQNAISKAKEILTNIRNKFEEVKQAIRDKLTEAVKVVGEKIGEMPGKVLEFASDMVSAGKDLVSGLIEGIKGMGASAIEAITGVVGGVVDKAKDLLKISSPSKVFEQFGEWTGEGFVDGISAMVNDVQKASSKMTKAAIPKFEGLSKFDGLNLNSHLGQQLLASPFVRSTPETKIKAKQVMELFFKLKGEVQ